MSDEVWKEVFVAVVSGVIVSSVTWLLQGTFKLVAVHPWLIVAAGLVAAAAMAISRYLWLERPVTFPDDLGSPDYDSSQNDYFDSESDYWYGEDETGEENGVDEE